MLTVTALTNAEYVLSSAHVLHNATPLQKREAVFLRGQSLIGLLTDRACVEDDEIGILLRHGLPHAERLEHALDALGVVAVHLTAECGDVIAFQQM